MYIDGLLVDNAFLPIATSFASCAKKSIYICTFKAELTTKPRGRKLAEFFTNVYAAAQQGLDVKVLISKSGNYGHIPSTNLFAVRSMKENKVKVRHLLNDRTCHAKILIFDGEVAIFGSHNLSVKSCHNNFEISYICYDSYIIGQLLGIYQKVWDNAKDG